MFLELQNVPQESAIPPHECGFHVDIRDVHDAGLMARGRDQPLEKGDKMEAPKQENFKIIRAKDFYSKKII